MSKNNKNILSIIDRLRPLIRQKLDTLLAKNALKQGLKSDGTIVTEFDLWVSNLIKDELKSSLPDVSFYSEEDIGEFQFPVAILDPIDGTRELAEFIPQCAVSFGIYYSEDYSDQRNFSWIYNPFTGFEVCSESLLSTKPKSDVVLVSRTEFEAGLYTEHDENIMAVGSIAYKLALLASGECKGVITKRDKNIWDIVAGIHLCYLAGIKVESTQKLLILPKKIKSPIELYNLK